MSVLPSTPIPAGWYPDPAGSFQQRWWNGTSWTNDFAQYRPTLIHSAPLAEALQSGGEQPAFGEFATKKTTAARAAGSPTSGSTSTLTRDESAPFGLPAEDRAPLTSVNRPNAGNAILVPVTPVNAAPTAAEPNSAWDSYKSTTPATQAKAAAPVETPEPSRRAHVGPTRRYTAAAWLLAILPALFVGGAAAVAVYLPNLYSTVALLVLGGAFLLLGVLLGAADRRVLFVNDHEFAASPAWGILTPLSYLSVRSATVSRETGKAAYAPLIVLLVTVAAIVASLILVSGLLTLLTPTVLY